MRLGVELVRQGTRILELRPHTGIPEPFIVSVPFVNAHSHLEYRGLQGALDALPYWEWIRELTRLKLAQPESLVREDCRLAAQENRRTGVGWIGEHSDRPYAGAALHEAGIGGIVFQEVITFFERETREAKLAKVAARAEAQRREFGGPVVISPHALYTVDEATLRTMGSQVRPLSIHLAESIWEREFYAKGTGPIADFYVQSGVDFECPGLSPVQVAAELKLLRPGTQVVHGCDVDASDLRRLRQNSVGVAHCPRSNEALGCPKAPVREMLGAGIAVGLGLDSAASSGPIDFFEEMRAALRVAELRGHPLRAEQVWNMATGMGAMTLGRSGWRLAAGYEGALISLALEGATHIEEAIEAGTPEMVSWIE